MSSSQRRRPNGNSTALPPLIPRAPYLARKMPEHPLATTQGYVLEHRRVAWEHFGPFDPALHVRHINGDTVDNRPANLELLSLADHARHHGVESRKHDYDAIVADYTTGMTTTRISAKYGLNAGSVSRLLRRMGVETRPKGVPRGTPKTMESRLAQQHPLADQLVAAYLAGDGCESVGARFGVGHSTVVRAVRRAGFQPRPVGRPRQT